MILKKIRIVLVNTTHPGNIGATARAMKNMGLSSLYLVSPVHFPDAVAYSRASSATDILDQAVVVPTLADALEGCGLAFGASARLRTIQWPQLDPRGCAEKLLDEAELHDVALVLGRERNGLTNEELEQCQYLVHIPTNPEYSSLNVAAAVQVLVYEIYSHYLARNTGPADAGVQTSSPEDRAATIDQVDGFYGHLHQALEDLDFFGSNNPEVVMRRLRRLFNRACLSRREVNILRGILSAAQGRRSMRPASRSSRKPRNY